MINPTKRANNVIPLHGSPTQRPCVPSIPITVIFSELAATESIAINPRLLIIKELQYARLVEIKLSKLLLGCSHKSYRMYQNK